MKKLFSVNYNMKNVDFVLLIIRISIAILMLTHGVPKINGFAESPVKFMNVLGMGTAVSLGLAIFAEVGCSILILLGLGTRLAVFPLSITMLIAAFHVHIGDPFAKQEMSLHYLLIYFVLFILGSGKYSLDSLLVKKENNLLSKKMVTANR